MTIHQTRRIENAAILAHEVNRAYCHHIGDASQVPWADAPAWQKDSAIAGVNTVLNNPGTKPGDSHASWMAHKIADGWTHGPVKDPEKKQHPSLVPFEDLEPSEQMKDHLFLGTAKGALRAYSKREVFPATELELKLRVAWRATQSEFTIGSYVILGRMGIVFDAALRAHDRAHGHPVREKADNFNRFAQHVGLCMAVADGDIGGMAPGARAYDAYRAKEWPRLLPEPNPRELWFWTLCHRIVHTMMEIEGVVAIPPQQMWRMSGTGAHNVEVTTTIIDDALAGIGE